MRLSTHTIDPAPTDQAAPAKIRKPGAVAVRARTIAAGITPPDYTVMSPRGVWPPDHELSACIGDCHGVLGMVAHKLGVRVEQVQEYVSQHPELEDITREAARHVDYKLDLNVRQGVEDGDIGWSAMRIKILEKSGAMGLVGGGAGAGVGVGGVATPVDYTREVAGAADCTDAELLAAIRRQAMRDGKRLRNGDVCPCCGCVVSADAVQVEPVGNGGAGDPVVEHCPAVPPTKTTSDQP